MGWRARIVWRRAIAFFSRAVRDRDLDDEIAGHLELAAAAYEARGLPPAAARRAALRDFGSVAHTKEAYRDVRGFAWLDSLARDARFAIRVLRKAPVFTAVAVSTIAFGVGANGAIFSVADALLSHPLPGIDGSRLAVVAVGEKAPAAPADYLDWQRLNTSFTDLAAYRQRDVNLSGDGPAERLYAADVTSSFFAVLGLNAVAGRTLLASDATEGRVAVLAHGFWQRRFGGDERVVGRVVQLDGNPVTVVGVLANDVEVPVPTDVWLPLVLQPGDQSRRDTLILRVVGRLKPSATIETAQAEFTAIARQLELAYPVTNRNRHAHVMPLSEYVQGTITRRAIFFLLGCVAIVLAVASLNVAGLQLARAASRLREGMLRAALGASRFRVAQLAIVENLVVAAAGGAVGIVVAKTCLHFLLASMPADIVRLIPGFARIAVDARSLGFMAVVTVAAAVVAGAAPAFVSARGRLASSSPPQRFRSVLVAGQIAVAVVMLAVALVFAGSERELLRVHSVPQPDGVVVMNVALPNRYADEAARVRFYEGALDRFRTVSAVEAAAVCTTLPLSNNGTTWTHFEVETREASPLVPSPSAVEQHVSPDFFRLLGIPLREGRGFAPGDRPDTTEVAIVSSALARHHWPDGDAIGKRIRLGGGATSAWLEIVGIAGDVLYDWTNGSAEPVVYRPVAQAAPSTSVFLVRMSADTAGAFGPLTRALATVDPLVPAYGVMSLRDAISESFAGTTQIAAMMNMLAALALAIAVMGIYGVVAYTVATRTREFGVRMALGATRGDIFRLVMRHALVLTASGTGAGAAAGIAVVRATRAVVFGAGTAAAATTLMLVAIAVGLTTIVACCAPAHRATITDPMTSLRVD